MRTIAIAAALIIGVASVATAAGNCKAPALRQGMAYAKARKIVVAAGFQAPSVPPYGFKKEDCSVSDVSVCNKFPELGACSGDGYCNLQFTDPYGDTLDITTYGVIDDGSAGITSFNITCK